jgi:hypothetical protein
MDCRVVDQLNFLFLTQKATPYVFLRANSNATEGTET